MHAHESEAAARQRQHGLLLQTLSAPGSQPRESIDRSILRALHKEGRLDLPAQMEQLQRAYREELCGGGNRGSAGAGGSARGRILHDVCVVCVCVCV